jgi:hypothetical protein
MKLRPLRQRMRAEARGSARPGARAADAPGRGARQSQLSVLDAHGFGASLVVGLINRGLVMIMYERVRAGSTTIDVTNVPDRA